MHLRFGKYINNKTITINRITLVFSAGMFYQWHLNQWIGTLPDGSFGIKFGFVVPE